MTVFFFFNDTATTEIYTLSLHDALPISVSYSAFSETSDKTFSTASYTPETQIYMSQECKLDGLREPPTYIRRDRKSTRLNSSHANISYAVFCLKKKYYIIARYTVYPRHL